MGDQEDMALPASQDRALAVPAETAETGSALRASIPSAMAERKAVSNYLRTLTVRSFLNMRGVPSWRLLTILRHRWMMAAYSLAADAIERGEHHGTQEGWLVNLENGIFFAKEGRQTIHASAMSAREGQDAEERLGAKPASAAAEPRCPTLEDIQ